MYLLHLRCGQAVFSHETALFFRDLTDRELLKYIITVRTGYNPSRLQEDGFQVYTVKNEQPWLVLKSECGSWFFHTMKFDSNL